MSRTQYEFMGGGVLRDRYGRRQFTLRELNVSPAASDSPEAGTYLDPDGREQVVLYNGGSTYISQRPGLIQLVASETTPAAVNKAIEELNTTTGGKVEIRGDLALAGSTIKMLPRVELCGIGDQDQQNLGPSSIQGTAGIDSIELAQDSNGIHADYKISNLVMNGGKNHIVSALINNSFIYFSRVVHRNAEEAARRWYSGSTDNMYVLDTIVDSCGYAEKRDFSEAAPGKKNYIAKSIWRNEYITGCKRGFDWRMLEANDCTLDHSFCTRCEWDGYRLGRSCPGLLVIKGHTEGNGHAGKSNRTTGSVEAGKTNLTVASIEGYANGDPIVVAKAGPGKKDLITTVNGAPSGVTITLAEAASSTVINTPVTNAQYDDYNFEEANSNPVIFLGGLIGSETSYGHLRYAIKADNVPTLVMVGLSTQTSGIPVYDPFKGAQIIGGASPGVEVRQPEREGSYTNLLSQVLNLTSGMGVFGAKPPSSQHAAIASPAAELASLKTAVDELRAVVKEYGMTA